MPWYRTDPEDLLNWIDLGVWINGETGGYLRVCTEGRNWFETDFPNWLKEPAFEYKQENRSEEHGSYIVEGLETGRVYRGHFNVVNNGVITNLPDDAVIEAPGYVDHNGINMPIVGDLPLGCAAVCNVSISVQRLSVEAAYRQEHDELIPTQDYQGAARLHTKTVEEMALDREGANTNAGEADKAKVRPASE